MTSTLPSSRDTERQWLDPKKEATALTISNTDVTWEPDSVNQTILTLAGNYRILSPQNITAGKNYELAVLQDGTGNRLLSFGNIFRWHEEQEPVLSFAPGSLDLFRFYCDGTYLYGRLFFKSQLTDSNI